MRLGEVGKGEWVFSSAIRRARTWEGRREREGEGGREFNIKTLKTYLTSFPFPCLSSLFLPF